MRSLASQQCRRTRASRSQAVPTLGDGRWSPIIGGSRLARHPLTGSLTPRISRASMHSCGDRGASRRRSTSSAAPAGCLSAWSAPVSTCSSVPTPTSGRSGRTTRTCRGSSWCGDLSDPDEFLTTLSVWGIEHVDLVAGGVPCQPFSRAGRSRIRDLVDVRRARRARPPRRPLVLVRRGRRATCSPRPCWSRTCPTCRAGTTARCSSASTSRCGQLGYRVEARILDGFRYGVPQHRQRLILVGFERRPSADLARAERPTRRRLRDAIGDLPPIPRAQRAERLAYDARRQSIRTSSG